MNVKEKLSRFAYALYVKEWCQERGCKPSDVDPEVGLNGESYVCYAEFLDNEWRDKEYLRSLLPAHIYTRWMAYCKQEEEGVKDDDMDHMFLACRIYMDVCNEEQNRRVLRKCKLRLPMTFPKAEKAERAQSGGMSPDRRLELYDRMLDYITEVAGKSERVNVLRQIGFTDPEIYEEGFDPREGNDD